MKILVSGSRDYNIYFVFKKAMTDIVSELQYRYTFRRSDIEIVEGGAWGVDYMARRYSKEMRFSLKDFPANWDNLDSNIERVSAKYNAHTGLMYNKQAGHNRNIRMMDYINSHKEKAVICFQLDKSKGAQSMVDITLKSGLPLYHFSISSKDETKLHLDVYNTKTCWTNKYR